MTGKEVLRAIADGADVSEFEVADSIPTEWEVLWDEVSVKTLLDSGLTYRRKPRTRVVNGFTVPAPIAFLPIQDEPVFMANTYATGWVSESHWSNNASDSIWLDRGLLFSTKEAAIANAKAMVGVDPEAE